MPELLTIEHIAAMWHCSTRHARDTLVKTPGFPPPAPGSGAKHRVWLLKDVKAFANRKPAQNSHNFHEAA